MAEVFLCGRAAVEACIERRPAALREIFIDEKREKLFSDLRDRVAPGHCVWKSVPASDLVRLAGTSGRGGIVARTERPALAQVKPAMRDEWFAAGEKVLFLDGLSDAAQLASIIRVAAICGVSRIVADEKITVPALESSETWSLGGGALEVVKLYRTESMAGMMRMMGEKFFIVGLVREGGRRIDYSVVPTFPGKSVALFLSGAENGVPADMISRCGHLFHIAEPEALRLRLTPADLAAQILPWLSSKNKRPGAGFLARKKARAKNG